jgi:uncharacterized protein
LKRFQTGPDKYLVANAITGEVVVFNLAGLAILDALAANEQPTCDASVLEELRRMRFLFRSRDEEQWIFEQACHTSWIDFRRGVSRHYTFILNSHCNFNCRYCFERPEYRATASTLSRRQMDAAFRVIDRYSTKRGGLESPDIEIFGGEPLLPGSRPALEYLLRSAAERGLMASIQTNGFHLSSFVDLFAAFATHIRQIQLTLDGPPAVHDRRRTPKDGSPTFAKIVSGIEALRSLELPFRINIRMNVDRENIEYLEPMARFYEQRHWTVDTRFAFTAAPVDNRCGALDNDGRLLGWNELFEHVLPLSTDKGGGPYDLSVFKVTSHFRQYFAAAARAGSEPPPFTPKVVYCEAAAMKLMAFHPDGRIYPCPETVGMVDLAIGTYWPELILNRRKARQWRRQTILTRPRCAGCEMSTFCGGGCILTALMRNGSMSIPDCEQGPETLDSYFAQVRNPG